MGLARLALGPFPWDGTRGPSGSSGRWDMAGISTEFFDDYGPLKKWPPHAQLIHWELKCLSHNHSSRTDGPRLGIGHAWAIRFFVVFCATICAPESYMRLQPRSTFPCILNACCCNDDDVHRAQD